MIPGQRLESPKALLAQASALVSVTGAAATFFKTSAVASAATTHEAVVARARRKSAEAALKAGKERRREDWLLLSRAMADAAEEASRGVEECERFDVASDETLTRMSAELRDATQAAHAALGALGEAARCADFLVMTKRKASAVEGLNRRARKAAMEQPNVVTELKARAVYQRFSQAAESLQKIADVLGQIVALP